MAVVALLDLATAVPSGAPIAGLDLGSKTIGVAVCDTSLMIASPLALIRRSKFTDDANLLFALMAKRGAAGIVMPIGARLRPQPPSPQRHSHRFLGRAPL
jgi:putative Holliday junction resolvase